MNASTRLVRPAPVDGTAQPTSVPIFQTATFALETPGDGPWDYSRSGNPTRTALEERIADLEGGSDACAFASGMAAISAVLRCVRTGGRIVAGDDLYGGTFRLFGELIRHEVAVVDFVDITQPDAVAAALATPADLLFVETPSNPLLRVADVATLSRICREAGVTMVVDNSLLSPWRLRPLELGADIVVASATKYLGGHGDVTAGYVTTRDDEHARRIRFIQNAEGSALGPFDSWLLLRGMKTLGVRLDRQEKTAAVVADAVREHRTVRAVHTVAQSPTDEQPPGSVFAFETGDAELSRRVCEKTELFTIAVSFGSVASTIGMPGGMSHASIPDSLKSHRRFPDDLIRISIGLEDPEDLIRDLLQALDAGRLSARGSRAPARELTTRSSRSPRW